jgi:hypothetical protein
LRKKKRKHQERLESILELSRPGPIEEVYAPLNFQNMHSSRMIIGGDILRPTLVDVVELDNFNFDRKTEKLLGNVRIGRKLLLSKKFILTSQDIVLNV